MSDTNSIADLLHEAAETHHVVYRIVDGDDPDWASWYSEWLTTLSELPELLGTKPVRSELTYQLVRLDKEFSQGGSGGRWEDHYARELLERLAGWRDRGRPRRGRPAPAPGRTGRSARRSPRPRRRPPRRRPPPAGPPRSRPAPGRPRPCAGAPRAPSAGPPAGAGARGRPRPRSGGAPRR